MSAQNLHSHPDRPRGIWTPALDEYFKGKTTDEIATLVKAHPASVRRWRNGTPMDWDRVGAFIVATGLPMENFFPDSGPLRRQPPPPRPRKNREAMPPSSHGPSEFSGESPDPTMGFGVRIRPDKGFHPSDFGLSAVPAVDDLPSTVSAPDTVGAPEPEFIQEVIVAAPDIAANPEVKPNAVKTIGPDPVAGLLPEIAPSMASLDESPSAAASFAELVDAVAISPGSGETIGSAPAPFSHSDSDGMALLKEPTMEQHANGTDASQNEDGHQATLPDITSVGHEASAPLFQVSSILEAFEQQISTSIAGCCWPLWGNMERLPRPAIYCNKPRAFPIEAGRQPYCAEHISLSRTVPRDRRPN